MRSLGEFVGHIVKGLRTDPAKKVLRKDVQEQAREDGVILRRTTIEEIEMPARSASSPGEPRRETPPPAEQ